MTSGPIRLIHTADWQIGKPFLRFGDKADRLRAARLEAIESLGRVAVDEQVGHILVAGDIFDSETPARETLYAPIERMRSFPAIAWHLLPGNHDPHRPGGVWDRLRGAGTPENIVVHVSARPHALGAACWLLPCPLTNKSETRDLTLAMEGMSTPDGVFRIGLAHGNVGQFAGPDGDASNPIDPTRAERAGLAYLALGDWHRTQRITDRVWYAGTPEPDRHGSQTRGSALLITIDGRSPGPKVEARNVGTFHWHTAEIVCNELERLVDFETTLRREADPLSRLILKLDLSGTVSLAVRNQVAQWIERFCAAVCHLDLDDLGLRVRPEQSELESMDFDGVLRNVAERLKGRINDPALLSDDRRAAEDALMILYMETTALPVS
jgi:DNA repair exonuclease SbcCD nuclease subunit